MSKGWRPMHDDPKDRNVVWYDIGEPGFRLVLDPSLNGTYREAVLSTEVELLRERVRAGVAPGRCAEQGPLAFGTQVPLSCDLLHGHAGMHRNPTGGDWITRDAPSAKGSSQTPAGPTASGDSSSAGAA